jgi:EmrB/QacA subfamily drug resistance transporter
LTAAAGRRSIATIQWVPTVYLLAFAAVIPLTGWMSERFGAKRLWLASLALFTVGSVLAGLSWSIGALIVFRVVQGAGGGVIMPLGQTILAQVAGPQRMGRVMAIMGVPLLLAPICGPIIGGALVSGASWRWVFFVNLPISAAAMVAAVRVLPGSGPSRTQRLDWPSVVLLSGGIAVALYGLAEVGQKGSLRAAVPLTALVVGVCLVVTFVVRALRTPSPLVDVRLFAARGFATSAVTNFVLGIALFGVALLLPLYFQRAQARSTRRPVGDHATQARVAGQPPGQRLTARRGGRSVDVPIPRVQQEHHVRLATELLVHQHLGLARRRGRVVEPTAEQAAEHPHTQEGRDGQPDQTQREHESGTDDDEPT